MQEPGTCDAMKDIKLFTFLLIFKINNCKYQGGNKWYPTIGGQWSTLFRTKPFWLRFVNLSLKTKIKLNTITISTLLVVSAKIQSFGFGHAYGIVFLKEIVEFFVLSNIHWTGPESKILYTGWHIVHYFLVTKPKFNM